MKKIYTLLIVSCSAAILLAFCSVATMAQAPQGFNYQATVRDGNGQLIINQNVHFIFNIMRNSPTSLPVYSETHYAPTDDLGTVSLVIGQGTPTTGVFAQIPWGEGEYYLGIELNTGNGYVAMGTTQLLSVPYALYANSVNLRVSHTGDTLYIGPQWVIIPGISEANNNEIPTGTVADIDGNEYPTVIIGNQEWMAENLKVTHYRNGEPIAYPGDAPDQWSNLSTGAYAWYNNNMEWKHIYGGLYNFYAVVNENGLCPEGWHVPTNEDWTVLMNTIGSDEPTGNLLKSCRQVESPLETCSTSQHPRWDYHAQVHGNNHYGFSAVPGGIRGVQGNYEAMGTNAEFWTSTEIGSGRAWARIILNGSGYAATDDGYMKKGISVRCVK